ncbi:hypothetical protein D3C87_1785070 [compost metagenome]
MSGRAWIAGIGTGTPLRAPYWMKAAPGCSVWPMRSPANGPPTASRITSKTRAGGIRPSPATMISPKASEASRSALRWLRTIPIGLALSPVMSFISMPPMAEPAAVTPILRPVIGPKCALSASTSRSAVRGLT